MQIRLNRLRRDAAQVIPINDPYLLHHYPPNTVIYAASTQLAPAINQYGNGEFTYRLFSPFVQRKPPVQSFQQSMDQSRVRLGWILDDRSNVQVPTQSSRRSIYWHLGDNNLVRRGTVKRYALLITGEGQEAPDVPGVKAYQERVFKNDTRLVKRALAQAFKLPPENIRVLHKPTLSQLHHTLKTWLGPRQHPNDEVLLYYSGHGSADFVPYDWANVQGSGQGKLHFRDDQALTKDRLKNWLWRYAHGFGEVVCVLDACNTGTFVARRDPIPRPDKPEALA